MTASHGLPLVEASGDYSSCGGFSQSTGSGACGLSSCGFWFLQHRLNSCGTWSLLLRGVWYLPGSGVGAVSLALTGGFFTEPPGKPQFCLSFLRTSLCFTCLGFIHLFFFLKIFYFIYSYPEAILNSFTDQLTPCLSGWSFMLFLFVGQWLRSIELCYSWTWRLALINHGSSLCLFSYY